jgi:hypothetical protein
VGRAELLVVFLTVLAVVAAAWFIKAGHWRRGRLLLVTLAIFGVLGLLSRRLGLGELVIVLVLVLVPFFVLPARRPPSARRRPDGAPGPDRPLLEPRSRSDRRR